jgi:prevent-host-death family protein
MKRYTTRQARQNLSKLLQAAREGEEIVITSPNESSVRLVADQLSALARFRAWKAAAMEIEEDPLANIRDEAEDRKVRL